jgi:hypothetical protein
MDDGLEGDALHLTCSSFVALAACTLLFSL